MKRCFIVVKHTLENTVKKIHFTSETGLVFCDRLNRDIHISERYHIQEKAIQLDEVKAVLFRRKYNENSDLILDVRSFFRSKTKFRGSKGLL